MQAPIRAAYFESVDHMVNAVDRIPKKRLSMSFRIFMFIIGPLIMGLLSYLHQEWGAFIFGCLIYYGFIYLSFFCRPYQRWQVKRHLAKHFREEPVPVEWMFADPDVLVRKGTESSTQYSWAHFQRVIQRPDGFLLETPNKQFHWIPRESFSPIEDFENLIPLLKQKISLYERVVK